MNDNGDVRLTGEPINEKRIYEALTEIDKRIGDGMHPERYASYTSEDAGKTSGLMTARRIIKDAIGK